MNVSSSIILIPSSFALVSFEPASSPASTNEVFRLTLDEVFPPASSIILLASSLERVGRVPVSTKV